MFGTLVYCALALTKEGSNTAGPDRYGFATHLLQHLHPEHFPQEQLKQDKIKKVRGEIMQLSDHLWKEEQQLRPLEEARDNLKRGLLWLFEPDVRYSVDEAQLTVNDHLRVIDHLVEEIDLRWKELKPLYGIWSKMFLVEMLSFVPRTILALSSMLLASLSFGLISFLMFGPLSYFFVLFWWTFGFALLPFVIFGLTLYWVLYIPFIMIQYGPSLTEFLVIYIPILLLYALGVKYFANRTRIGRAGTVTFVVKED